MRKVLLLLLASMLVAPTVHANASSNELVLGVVSAKPKNKIKQGKPFAEHMAQQLKEYGYESGAVRVFPSYEQLGHALQSGKVHLATATPFNAIYLESNYNSSLVANRWKRGQEKYHSVFFTRQDSDIHSLSGLRGKRIAFEKDDSTSSYYLPSVTLQQHGETLQYLSSLDQRPDPDKVGYILLNEHLDQSNEVNLSLWVFKQRIDASAFSNYNWDNPKDLPQGIKKQLKVFARSVDIPRDLLIASPVLTDVQVQKIQSVVTSLHHDEANKAWMQAFQKTTQFSAIDEELNASLDTVRQSTVSAR